MNSESGLTVTLVEHIATGHHMEYLLNAISDFDAHNIKIHFVGAPQICEKIKDTVQSVTPLDLDTDCKLVRRELNRISFCKQVFILAKNNNSDLIHFLYVDRLIRALFFSGCKFEIPILATLHWAYMLPSFTNTLKQQMAAFIEKSILKCLLNKRVKLVVHSTLFANEFNEIKRNSTSAINYPVAQKYQFSNDGRLNIRAKLGLKTTDKLLLCFGGTRLDKGADVAVETLKMLSGNYHLLIAGKEECITYNHLETIALNHNCRTRLHFIKGYIDDHEVTDIFSAADILLLPYNSVFSGQSGPLTIAAAMGLPILSTHIGTLTETINQYRLGLSIEAYNDELYPEAIKKLDSFDEIDTKQFVIDSSVFYFSRRLVSLYQELHN